MSDNVSIGPDPEAQANTNFHMQNLATLRAMPAGGDIMTGIEILSIMRLCNVYAVDFSPYLEADEGEDGRPMATIRVDETGARIRRTVRVRTTLDLCLLDKEGGVHLPDMDIVTAELLLGELENAASRRLEIAAQKRGK